MLIKDLTLN